MADKKISALTSAVTPLGGTEAGVRSALTHANFVDYSGIVLTLTYRAA